MRPFWLPHASRPPMALQSSSTSSSLPLEIILETGEENPRKRRRNRARISCINCYASKRKCDRKRPCTRCITLGQTGLCAYELDDPSSRNKEEDETTHLKSRIAELESVLRQLKKRPHPCWTAPGGVTHDPGLVAARRKSRRRPRADSVRSVSVETFFAAVADSDEEEDQVKVEQKSHFVPEFTPSELEYPDNSVPVTDQAPRSASTPFTFDDDPTETSARCPPLSSFIQGIRGDTRSFPSSESQANHVNPAPSSAKGPTLSSLLGREHGVLTADVIHLHSSQSSPVNFVAEFLGARAASTMVTDIQTSSISSRSQTVLGQQHCSTKGSDACQCLNTTALFNPLLHFAIALRTSREALQGLHASISDCDLFRRIVELENQIFSADPPAPETINELSLARDDDNSTIDSAPEPNFALSAPPSHTELDLPMQHSYMPPFRSLSRAMSPPSLDLPYLYPLPPTHCYELDAFCHLAEPSACPQLQDWM